VIADVCNIYLWFGVSCIASFLHEFIITIFIPGIATTKLTLQELMHYSLLSVQASRLSVDLHLEIDKILTKLIKQQALNTIDPKQSR
jgi:hypothetical protein